MKITRAQSTDGRVFRSVNGTYHETRIGGGQRAVAAKAVNAAAPSTITHQPSTPLPAGVSTSLARILRPQAAYRWLLPQVASITPQYIEMVLRSALTGNHVQQWELFDLMLDTWPELSACQQELTYGVTRQKLIFEPFAEEDEDPTPEALDRCKLVSAALRRMAPDAAADENDLEGTLKDILDGWFRGVTALEIDWQSITSGVHGTMLAPRSTFWVHPVCFAFDQDGRLGLRVDARGQLNPANLGGTSVQPQPAVVGAFPPHKFLVGIHKAKSGTALGGALLRPLAWWWCAANFSADWLLNLAQIFGLPFRWANYDPTAAQDTVDRICSMLQNMGSAGWAAFPTGTTMELLDTSKTGDHSPQGELLDRADRYARLLILGQTMSGSQDASKGGGKAFGAVESNVKAQRIDAAGRYACRVINTQLIPSILTLNYGDADEAPKVRLLEDEEAGLTEAQRDMALAKGGLKIPTSFLRKKYSLPAPSDDEEVLGGTGEDKSNRSHETHGSHEEPAPDAELAAKLRELSTIRDDALFARELRALADTLS
jgi:phage gp29-like protein